MAEETKRTAAEERQSYIAGYEADAAAWRNRLAECEAMGFREGHALWDQATHALKNALRHLETYAGKGQDKAERRPRASSETR